MLPVSAANIPVDSLQDKRPVLSSLVEGDIEAQRTAPKKIKTPKDKKVKQPRPPKSARRIAQLNRFKEVAIPLVLVCWMVLWITLVAWGAPKGGGWGEKGKPMVVWAVLAGSLLGAVPVLIGVLVCSGKYIRYGGSAVEELE